MILLGLILFVFAIILSVIVLWVHREYYISLIMIVFLFAGLFAHIIGEYQRDAKIKLETLKQVGIEEVEDSYYKVQTLDKAYYFKVNENGKENEKD